MALLLVVVGCVLLVQWRQSSAVQSRGLVVEATVREVYEGDNTQEVWLEYHDTQGQSHWLHGPMAARRNAKVLVRYDPAQPDRATLANQSNHLNFVSLIFGLYALGWGLFLGYKLWKS